MIEIWEPRYRDRKVLIANHKLTPGRDTEVKIVKGFYKGVYAVKWKDIANSNIEHMQVRRGGTMQVRAVPVEKLIRKGKDE